MLDFPSREYVAATVNHETGEEIRAFLLNPCYKDSLKSGHIALDLAMSRAEAIWFEAGSDCTEAVAEPEYPEDGLNYPSMEYTVTIYKAGTDEVVSPEKLVNPDYYSSRKGAHRALDWAMGQGHDIRFDPVT